MGMLYQPPLPDAYSGIAERELLERIRRRKEQFGYPRVRIRQRWLV